MIGPSRVLLVLDRAARAGTERHVLLLAEGLIARGWEVSLAVTGGGPLLPLFAKAGIAVHRVARDCGPDPLYAIRLAVWRGSFARRFFMRTADGSLLWRDGSRGFLP